ncbi:MAG: calcium/proton exchanger [Chloroflexi bacterium]|nr:calcium/proton exchanger [Chloroflexota bacterium]
MLAGIAAIIARLAGAPDVVTFALSAVGIIPLAGLIGRSTEDLAHHIGPKFGGLLNATFGNAAELIIAIAALREGLLSLVKASITGSIIGNVLLVLGMGLLLGGWRHGVQRFDSREAGRNSTMMLLALFALILPAVFAFFEPSSFVVEEVSIGFAVVLLLLYGAYIAYSLTPAGEVQLHSELMPPTEIVHAHRMWSAPLAVGVLLGATIATVVLSEILVGTIESVTRTIGLSEFFVGIVLVPLVGNVAEHLSAVQFAARNKLDVSLAIAAGSSTQIALLVAPLLVLLSLVVGRPMNLVFHPLEIVVVGATAGVFTLISFDGESNWLEGVQLLGLYLMAGVVFFFLQAHA